MAIDKKLVSSIFVLSASWLSKALGLISTIVLARLLTPEDFGVVAICTLVIYFFELFSNIGTKQYLLSKHTLNKSDLDIAWTLNALLKGTMAFFVWVFAGDIAGFLNSPSIESGIEFSSLILLLLGLENPAINIAKRELNYKGIFYLTITAKVISFLAGIFLAYTLRSYWALIYATLINFFIMTVGSYYVRPYKPTLSFKGLTEQWTFSKWILLKGFVGYSKAKGDTFILAKFFNKSDLGLYNIAKDLSMIVYEQIALPIADIITSEVGKSSKNATEAATKIESYFVNLMSILLPATLGIMVLSQDIVIVLLGEQWRDSAGILNNLALIGMSSSCILIVTSALIALNKVKESFFVDVLSTIVVLGGLYFAKSSEITEFSLYRSLLDCFSMLIYFGVLLKILHVKVKNYVVGLMPSSIASAVMVVLITYISNGQTHISVFWMLLKVFTGAVSYFAILYLSLMVLAKEKGTLITLRSNIDKAIISLVANVKQ